MLNVNQQQQVRKLNAAAAAANVPHSNMTFPGQNMGLDPELVKKISAAQPNTLGVSFVGGAGSVVQPSIQLQPTTQYMLGIVFAGTGVANDTFSLSLNNQKIIDGAAAGAYFVGAGKPLLGYYEFFRFVGGASSMQLDYLSSAANDIVFNIVYVQW